jgi:hypothetical protein
MAEVYDAAAAAAAALVETNVNLIANFAAADPTTKQQAARTPRQMPVCDGKGWWSVLCVNMVGSDQSQSLCKVRGASNN